MVALDKTCLCHRKPLQGIITAGKKKKGKRERKSERETVNEERKQVLAKSK